MAKPTIEFCASNMHHGTDRIMNRLEQNPSLTVIEYGCLGNCGECYLYPYALVNGRIVAAESLEELENKIQSAVQPIV